MCGVSRRILVPAFLKTYEEHTRLSSRRFHIYSNWELQPSSFCPFSNSILRTLPASVLITGDTPQSPSSLRIRHIVPGATAWALLTNFEIWSRPCIVPELKSFWTSFSITLPRIMKKDLHCHSAGLIIAPTIFWTLTVRNTQISAAQVTPSLRISRLFDV